MFRTPFGAVDHFNMSDGLSRAQAERLIASAYRIPLDGSSGVKPAESAPKLRALTPLPPRGLTPLVASASDFYLQQSGVQFYVEDLVQQLQDKRPENAAQFIANYFAAVVRGVNIKGRVFEYVNGCLQNRIAFLSQLQRSYAKIDQSMALSVGDFTEMLWCQCRDLPPQLVKQATCHLPMGEDGQRRAPLRTLLAVFSACFFYNEFLNKTFDVYNDNTASSANTVTTDRIVARLRVVSQQNTFNIPPMVQVEQIVAKSPNFNEFCRQFYENPEITASIVNLQLAFQKLAPSVK